jgi:hypothetical protein
MTAAVRYTWMFRTAAVPFVLLGASLLWRFGFTDYQPQYRPYGLAIAIAALAIGTFLFRQSRIAIGASAAVSLFICLCATIAAPSARGPVILLFASLAILSGAYAALAARVLFERGPT